MSILSAELDRRYREALRGLLASTRSRVSKLYDDTVTADDLDAAFAAFTQRAAPLIEAGQSAGVALSDGYLSTLVALETASSLEAGTAGEIVGTTVAGASLSEGMAAWSPMVKDQIGKGVGLRQALDYGRYLAERFSDAEVTGAVDRRADTVTRRSGRFKGWRGILAGTCEPCRRKNGGDHSLDESIYRHPNCRCTKEFIVGEGDLPTQAYDPLRGPNVPSFMSWSGQSSEMRAALRSPDLADETILRNARAVAQDVLDHGVKQPTLYRGLYGDAARSTFESLPIGGTQTMNLSSWGTSLGKAFSGSGGVQLRVSGARGLSLMPGYRATDQWEEVLSLGDFRVVAKRLDPDGTLFVDVEQIGFPSSVDELVGTA